VTYFEGSSFEQTIDVGECVGSCSGFGLSKLTGCGFIKDCNNLICRKVLCGI